MITGKPARKKASGRTLSERELQQRRAASKKSTGPKTEAGKTTVSRNAWKHGMTSQLARQSFKQGADSIAQLFGKPCLRTCPMHPDNPNRDASSPICSLVVDGLTNVGGNCLDKTVYVNAFTALMDAMSEGNMDGMHGVLAAEGAAMLQMLGEIRNSISREGLLLKIPMVNKEGNVIRDDDDKIIAGEYKPNPLLPAMILLFDKLGISLPEMLATPQARSRADTGEAAADTFQTLLGGIMNRAGGQNRATLPALPHEAGDQ
jgi:hypothetical protein